MTVIKGHICPSCAGALSIDIDRQMYICPFCGVTFDYEYFNEDNVLGIGSEALTNKEFNGASKAYSYMLEKDPHDFEALKGALCVKMKWRSFGQIKFIRQLPELTKAQRDLSELKKAASEKDRFFFEEVEKCFDIADKHEEIVKKIETNKEAADKCDRRIDELRAKLDDKKNYYDYAISHVYGIYGSIILLFIFMIIQIDNTMNAIVFFMIHLAVFGLTVILDRVIGSGKKKEDAALIAGARLKKEELLKQNSELDEQADKIRKEFIGKCNELLDYKA